MKNSKRVISLLLVAMMAVLAVAPTVMAATTKNVTVYATIKDANGRTLDSSKTYTDIKAGDTITVTAECPDKDSIEWSTDTEFMNAFGYKVNSKGMAILAYVWDNETKAQAKVSSDPTKMIITVPNFAEGSTHTLKVEAVGAIDGLEDGGVRYVANTNWIAIKFTIPTPSTKPATTAATSLTYNRRELSTSKVEVVEELSSLELKAITNGTVDVLGYKWDDLPSRGGDKSSYTLPIVSDFMPGETHTLQVQMITVDGVKSEKQTYKIKIAAKAADPVDEPEEPGYDNDGELIVEPWMREEDGLNTLAVSLRNDSEEEDKANKNIYAWG